ncbi:MAG: alpha/beta hydrolase [Bacteroidia bacterium]|nr:alpha/beta hydrolase [Bacteroidia bacterium]
MNSIRYIYVFSAIFITLCGLQAQKPLEIGKQEEFHSEILGEKRILNVYIPDEYTQIPATTFPCLYVLDGSRNEDFLHIVGLAQFYRLIGAMPPTIVIGIANVDRRRDFTFPTSVEKDKKDFPTTGGSEAFRRFIKEELQPFVEEKYGRGSKRILIGQSLGGLLACEILLKDRDLFDTYMIVSPSLWWDNGSLLKEVAPLIENSRHFPAEVFVSAGHEGRIMQRDARKLYQLLQKQRRNKIDPHFSYLRNEDHLTILHQALYQNLRMLYPLKKAEN